MSFLSALALIILWVLIILVAFFSSFGAPEQSVIDRSAVLERLKAIEVVAVKGEAQKAGAAAEDSTAKAVEASAPEAAAGEIDGGAITTATCAACHSIGLLESPKIGDREAWEKRIQANGGMDGLVKSAIAGKGAMPARGGNAGLSDAEVKAAIEFMMQ
ncbi:MAG: c-type cytochrome [gamma proteobacterium symbiont of Bathyaustriella thionipta]|nr:c-type cytochrome [gamma proteobacterium symbiont of Bathyaustriella thionipta]MCU7950978.1 c-type cytochrome [gamma proteobacterium symbiont of Bathyaustriella thionipta]MCU7952174.1 c-type cytochrome [gamma proteobacterium symbiont of Bathyaustriella thionipta]MCU7957472.1 c-type cytochrome [gamma proteobacterium symbiont of Bathyaustriella thionipta]MCU7967436.1 c-type cytochrome [gamma proteobacterium symbiont of Bathyaustriella thionipta]